ERGKKKLVIVIDALDEGIGNEEENIPNVIPDHIPEYVSFLLSYRVNQNKENKKVERNLHALPPERIRILQAANPLNGLKAEDVKEFLFQAHRGTTPDSTFERVWEASSRDLNGQFADPFYLRFVLDGVYQKRIFLERSETIPDSLDDAFEMKWVGLPEANNFLCHRLLLYLAIMRDHGDDELFVELFNREKIVDEPLTASDIAETRLHIGKLLIYDGDRYTIFHDRFRHFLVGEQKDPIAEALGIED
ncbi:MAG: hypothetical protein VX278_24255, partial [Myxococcota bacterium]|nr:hypothetical protein [Myxococcota bacterium]